MSDIDRELDDVMTAASRYDRTDAEIERGWLDYKRNRKAESLRARFSEAMAKGFLTEAVRTANFRELREDVVAMNPMAWTQAENWERENLFIFGDIGIGKSHLCRCILRREFVRGRRVAECSTLGYLMRARQFGSEEWCLSIKSSAVLLLDDIDKNNWRGEHIPQLWDLFDYRSSRKLPTLITSNLDTGALLAQMKAQAPENSSIALAALDRLKPITKLEMRGRSVR